MRVTEEGILQVETEFQGLLDSNRVSRALNDLGE